MIGVCFSGEGARGAIQAAILKQLLTKNHKGMKVDFVTGTSSGAINASMYSRRGIDELIELWRGVNNLSNIFEFNKVSVLWKSGAFNQNPAKKLIDEVFSKPDFYNSECEIPYCNLETGKVEWDVLNTKEGLLRAFAMSGIVETNIYADAGIALMTPLLRPIERGCDKIIIILGRNLYNASTWKANQGLVNILKKPIGEIVRVGMRSIEIMLFTILKRDIEVCIEKNSNPNYKKIDLEVWGPTIETWGTFEFEKAHLGIDLILQGNYERIL